MIAHGRIEYAMGYFRYLNPTTATLRQIASFRIVTLADGSPFPERNAIVDEIVPFF